MYWKVTRDVTCVVVDVEHPQGVEIKFPKNKRLWGDRREVYNNKCNFANNDILIYGLPLDAIQPDNTSASGVGYTKNGAPRVPVNRLREQQRG